MKDLNYILIVAFIFAFMGVNFLEQGNIDGIIYGITNNRNCFSR